MSGCTERADINKDHSSGLELPTFSLTDSAYRKCQELLKNENSPKARLIIAKGHYEEENTEGIRHNIKEGWMIFVVNKDQFLGDPIVKVHGLDIIASQSNLYDELNGKTIDYANGWWSMQ